MSGTEVKIVKSNFRAVREGIRGETLMKVAMSAGLYVQNNARMAAPVDTGNLRASIVAEPEEQGTFTAWVQIGTNVAYAAIQELGGIIKPKSAKRLSWKDEAGNWHFANAVQINAQPYLRPAMENHEVRIKWIITHTLNMIFERATS